MVVAFKKLQHTETQSKEVLGHRLTVMEHGDQCHLIQRVMAQKSSVAGAPSPTLATRSAWGHLSRFNQGKVRVQLSTISKGDCAENEGRIARYSAVRCLSEREGN